MNDLLSSGDESPEATSDGVPERTLHKQLFSNSVTVNANPGAIVNLYSAVGVQSVTNTKLLSHDGLDQAPGDPAGRQISGSNDIPCRPRGLVGRFGSQSIVLLLCVAFVAWPVFRYLQVLATLKS